MWQIKTEIIPVVIGALGVIKKGSEKFISEIPGNINLQEIQTGQHCWERPIFYGRSYLSSNNQDKATL